MKVVIDMKVLIDVVNIPTIKTKEKYEQYKKNVLDTYNRIFESNDTDEIDCMLSWTIARLLKIAEYRKRKLRQ